MSERLANVSGVRRSLFVPSAPASFPSPLHLRTSAAWLSTLPARSSSPATGPRHHILRRCRLLHRLLPVHPSTATSSRNARRPASASRLSRSSIPHYRPSIPTGLATLPQVHTAISYSRGL